MTVARAALAFLVSAIAFVACGGDDGSDASSPGTPGSGGGPGGGDAPGATPPKSEVPPGAITPPSAICTPPIAAADVSKPTTVVGSGTAASCTGTALAAAVATGGVVTFSCGSAPATIVVSAELNVTKDTVIDGGDKVTLSGDKKSRILVIKNADSQVTTPTLTVQNVTLQDGYSTDIPNTKSTDHGGAAIFANGGTVHAIHASFYNNHGPQTGQDVGGGAIYGRGQGEIVVVGSVFAGNSAASAGAIGALYHGITIVNSTLTSNTATGTGANSASGGDGGNGGAITMDGELHQLVVCGSTFNKNVAGAIGGAIFRTAYHSEVTRIEKSTFDENSTVDGNTPSQASAIYLQGSAVTIDASTISNNVAPGGGALSIVDHGGSKGSLVMTNTTIAGNRTYEHMPFEKWGVGSGLVMLDGSSTAILKNCTIAGNKAQFGSGIWNVANVTLTNTIVANDAGNVYVPPNCTGDSPGNGDHNLQGPKGMGSEVDCSSGIVHADPKLGPLADNGGPTKTMLPLAGSPVIGAGAACPAEDQRGTARGATCTLGAAQAP